MNGYKNWTQWNVSLWINNDEGLYRLAKRYARQYGKTAGAKALYVDYFENQKTPDGARYSVTAIRAAMVDM